MASIASIVDLLHPTVSGIGIITNDQVWVLFDREIDETTIAGGNFFVTGPDFDTWSGPDLQIYLDAEQLGDESEILQSPGFHGIVQGTLSYERIDLNSVVTVTGLDTVGSGHLYRTKAIFTPTNRLQADTEYRVYLSGDEDDTDSINTGISSRTVFDTLTSGSNTGTGTAEFTGGYTGFVDLDTYRIEITTSGEVGDARFIFVRDSDPISIFGPFRTKYSSVLLSDGVSVEFDEGLYRTGDKWSVVVKERDIFTGNLTWPFKTGSGSIETIPDSTATSVIGDPVETTQTTSTSSFSVSSTTPVDGASNQTLPVGEYTITAIFNSAIDASTVVSGIDVSVYAEAATGDADVPATGELIAEPSVNGQTLTITVASGLLKQNNLVTVTLDSTIQNISGISLGSDYSWSFSTAYYPMYCTERRMRIMIGAFIANVATDTVNLAIHIASLEADELTWNTDNLTDEYYMFARSQWTCCRAAQILLINTTGGSGSLKSKKLGDLQVEYDTSSGGVSKPLQNAEDCMRKWEGTLMAGGRQVQSAKMVVKGSNDGDRPPIGRGWMHIRDFSGTSQTPAANRRLREWTSRRYRNVFSRTRGWWER